MIGEWQSWDSKASRPSAPNRVPNHLMVKPLGAGAWGPQGQPHRPHPCCFLPGALGSQRAVLGVPLSDPRPERNPGRALETSSRGTQGLLGQGGEMEEPRKVASIQLPAQDSFMQVTPYMCRMSRVRMLQKAPGGGDIWADEKMGIRFM